MAALDKNTNIFVIHVAVLLATPIYLSREAQIGALLANNTSTKVSAEYLDYINIFLLDITMKLPEHTCINNHAINLVEDKQPLYNL